MNRSFEPPIHKNKRRPIALDTLAIEILAFLADDRDRLDQFLSSTGSSPDDLRKASEDAAFAEGLLAYLASDDRLLLTFAEAADHDPQQLGLLYASLSPARP